MICGLFEVVFEHSAKTLSVAYGLFFRLFVRNAVKITFKRSLQTVCNIIELRTKLGAGIELAEKLDTLPFSSNIQGRNRSLNLCGEEKLTPALTNSIRHDKNTIDNSIGFSSCLFNFRTGLEVIASAGRKYFDQSYSFMDREQKSLPLRGGNTSDFFCVQRDGEEYSSTLSISIYLGRNGSLNLCGEEKLIPAQIFKGTESEVGTSAGRESFSLSQNFTPVSFMEQAKIFTTIFVHRTMWTGIFEVEQKSCLCGEKQTLCSTTLSVVLGTEDVAFTAVANRPSAVSTSSVPMALLGRNGSLNLCGEEKLIPAQTFKVEQKSCLCGEKQTLCSTTLSVVLGAEDVAFTAVANRPSAVSTSSVPMALSTIFVHGHYGMALWGRNGSLNLCGEEKLIPAQNFKVEQKSCLCGEKQTLCSTTSYSEYTTEDL